MRLAQRQYFHRPGIGEMLGAMPRESRRPFGPLAIGRRGLGGRARLGGLGGGLGQEADRSKYDLAGSLLRDANSRIKALEQSVLTDPGLSQTVGSQVISARTRYTNLLQAYIYTYGIAFGPPDTAGLELGQWQVYVAAGAGIAVIVAAIYELHRYISAVENQASAAVSAEQAKQAQQANIAYAQQQIVAAQARGDTQGAIQWQQVAQANAAYQPSSPGAPTETFFQWITRNAGWVAAGVAGVLVVPELLRR